jgi:hypothetical protein
MSGQASDIAREAQEGLDDLMHKTLRVFQEIASAMLTPQARIKTRPSGAAKLTLKI